MDTGHPQSGPVTLTPLFWRRRGALFWLPVLATAIALEARESAPTWVLILLSGVVLFWIFDPGAGHLMITADAVIYRRRRLRPPRWQDVIVRVARSQIAVVDIRFGEISFASGDGEPLLSIPAGWTADQCRQIRDRVGVPVRDHRVRYAWRR